MRKKTLKTLFDSLFWYFVYLLPLILLTVSIFRTGTITSLSSVMGSIGVNILENNFIYTSLLDIFGTGGIFPLFIQTDLLMFLTYFISAFLLHLFVDIILFIPRFAMNLSDNFGKKVGSND